MTSASGSPAGSSTFSRDIARRVSRLDGADHAHPDEYGRGGLLPQPHGFEGLAAVGKGAPSQDLVITQRVDLRVKLRDFKSAPLQATGLAREDHDVAVGIDVVLDLGIECLSSTWVSNVSHILSQPAMN